jgi:hypothetical protein
MRSQGHGCLLRRRGWLVLIAAAGVYLAFALTNLSVPGPNYDEVADAIPALELLRGEAPVSALKQVVVFGQPLPLMMSHYIGPTSTYISLLGFLLFGPSIESLRLTQTLLGLVTLFLLWQLARTWLMIKRRVWLLCWRPLRRYSSGGIAPASSSPRRCCRSRWACCSR